MEYFSPHNFFYRNSALNTSQLTSTTLYRYLLLTSCEEQNKDSKIMLEYECLHQKLASDNCSSSLLPSQHQNFPTLETRNYLFSSANSSIPPLFSCTFGSSTPHWRWEDKTFPDLSTWQTAPAIQEADQRLIPLSNFLLIPQAQLISQTPSDVSRCGSSNIL